VGAVPPRSILVLDEGIGNGPVREEGGVGSLGHNDGAIEVCGSQGIKEEGIREHQNMFVIVGTSIVVMASRDCGSK
jgi:hypothetical protein